MFPQGERFFVWSVRNYEHLAIKEPLKSNIQEFYTQEKNHAAIHKSFNRSLGKLGYDIDRLEKRLEAKITKRTLMDSHIRCLAATVVMEHISAMVSEAILDESWMGGIKDPGIKKMWMWHAMEEVNHRSVAADVFELAEGSYWERVIALMGTVIIFYGELASRMAHFLKKDGLLFRPKTWGQILILFLEAGGIFHLTVWKQLSLLSPKFHPDLSSNKHHKKLDEVDLKVS